MPGNRPIPSPQAGTAGVIDEVTFHSRLVTTTAGAVDNTNTWLPAGQTLVKTATKVGRYTLTLPANYRRLLAVIVTPVGLADAIWGANTTGYDSHVRNIDIGAANQDGTVEIQFTQNGSNADAELPDGTGAMITVVVAQGYVR